MGIGDVYEVGGCHSDWGVCYFRHVCQTGDGDDLWLWLWFWLWLFSIKMPTGDVYHTYHLYTSSKSFNLALLIRRPGDTLYPLLETGSSTDRSVCTTTFLYAKCLQKKWKLQ